jgi:glycosyltransferase involved in cell wall biosynthesis
MALSSDLVVGVGPETTRSLNDAGLSPSRTTTVYNAVDAHVDRSRAEVRRELDVEDAELLVTVGRYAPEKDHALLLDAIARLAPTRPRLRALVIGGGPLEEALRRRVDELGLHAVVQLLGSREDAVAIAAAADVFALSSESEGLPLALLEAMVVGTAVVSTAVGGVGDAIRDGETGLLVPHGDPDALAAAVERLLDDERLRQRLVAAAREHVGERASPQAMIDRYAAIYLALAERRSPNAS